MREGLWQRELVLLPLITALTTHGLFVKLHVRACPMKALLGTVTCCKFARPLPLQAALSAGQT